MTLCIYRNIYYDFEHNLIVKYTLCVDNQYIMHYDVGSYNKNEEKDVIERIRRKVLAQPYINSILHPTNPEYVTLGELVHEENNTKLLKELEIKLRVKQLEEDFK